MSPEHREVHRRLRILEHAKETGNVCLTCRYFGIGRASFYRWKKMYDQDGQEGLVPGKPIGKRWPNQLPDEVVEKILHLRRKYHLGRHRIADSGRYEESFRIRAGRWIASFSFPGRGYVQREFEILPDAVTEFVLERAEVTGEFRATRDRRRVVRTLNDMSRRFGPLPRYDAPPSPL